ncbi:MAG: RNA methyltransferase, partial [Oscillospiraceae bacterium]|nr:RNA methyltransferase [Oscillospiraceae bacterium]
MSEQTKFEKKSFQEAEADGIIEGRNAVIEALRSETAIDKIYLAKGETDKTLGHIASKARAAGIVVVEADRRKLDNMSRTHAHQGVIALAAVREYATVEDILAVAADKGEAPLLVICDEISDPHNLGAIIRTAECAGAHGVIIPKRRSAGLTA